MSEYWKNHFNSNALKFPDSPLKQVENTVNGREIDRAQFDLMIKAIVTNLDIASTDYVADLCCGNGVVTKVIANLCHQVDAVDFSDNLIANARAEHAAVNIKYFVSGVESLPDGFFTQPTKGYMCYALQHLSEDDLRTLFGQISSHRQWKSFFISGVPDAERLTAFYDNAEKLAFYKKKEEAGEPHLGKWWSQSVIQSLVFESGLTVRFIPQPPELSSAYYRFDCLVERAAER